MRIHASATPRPRLLVAPGLLALLALALLVWAPACAGHDDAADPDAADEANGSRPDVVRRSDGGRNDEGAGAEADSEAGVPVRLDGGAFDGAADAQAEAEGSASGAGSGGSGGSDETDAGDAPPFSLTFETITLEGTPQAITDFAFIPGSDGQFLLLEKSGRVRHYALEGQAASLLGEVQLDGVFEEQDCGLIALAFDPDFEDNGYLFFGYCDSWDYDAVSRHVFDPDDYTLLNSSRAPILRVGESDAPRPWHNVGSIGFDAEGNLWALFGENADDPRAQELDNLMGTVVRVRPRRGADEEGYKTPGDNPFFGMDPTREETVAYGLRSPWRGAMDRHGRLWIGDVGGDYEELNMLAEWTGVNFGWPDYNGPCDGDCGGTQESVLSWNNSPETWPALDDVDAEPTQRRSVWVGAEYRAGLAGAEDPYGGTLEGKMLYGDFCGGWVRAIEVDALGVTRDDAHLGHLAQVTSMRQGPDGYLYATTYGNCSTFPYQPGRLVRAVPAR